MGASAGPGLRGGLGGVNGGRRGLGGVIDGLILLYGGLRRDLFGPSVNGIRLDDLIVKNLFSLGVQAIITL